MLKCTQIWLRQLKSNLLIAFLILFAATAVDAQVRRKPAPPGMPNEIQITPYNTTMIANGKDKVSISIKIIDSKGDSLPDVKRRVTFHIKGDARITTITNATGFGTLPYTDSTWQVNLTGSCQVILQAGRKLGIINFKITADTLWPGSTEIHTVQPGIAHAVTNKIYTPKKVTDKILGADISFLPQLESRGMKFSDNGVEGDAIEIMKAH